MSDRTKIIDCGECFGDPAQYTLDHGCVCEACQGDGKTAIEDWDDDTPGFDARAEWGTYRAVGGRVA